MENIDSQLGILIQTSGIFIALIFVIASFRLQSLRELMVGHGQAVLLQHDLYDTYRIYIQKWEPDYKRPEKKSSAEKPSALMERLRGSISLKEIFGIEEVLLKLTIGETLKFPNPGKTGLYRSTLPLFLRAKNWQTFIKIVTSIIIAIFSFAIFYALIAKGWIANDLIFNTYLVIGGVTLSVLFVGLIFFTYVGQESYKRKYVRNLKKEYPGIKKVYKREILINRLMENILSRIRKLTCRKRTK